MVEITQADIVDRWDGYNEQAWHQLFVQLYLEYQILQAQLFSQSTEIETLRAALLAERKRCALIVEEWDQTLDHSTGEFTRLAAAIRENPPMPYGEAVAYILSQGMRKEPTQ